MPKVRYNLVKTNAAGGEHWHIRLVFRYDGKKLVYYPGHVINSQDWNPKTQRLRKTADLAEQINSRLKLLETRTEAIYLEHSTAGKVLTPAAFRGLLDEFWKGRTNPKAGPVELLQFLEQMPKERHESGELAKDSLRAYSTLLFHLTTFQVARRRPVLFATIDLDFLPDFIAFLQMRGSKPNSIAKMVKTLKATMNLAHDRGLTDNTAYQSPRFTAKGERVEHIYLSESDLAKLEKADLTETLANARDLFLLGCCTGLRFSDLTSLGPDNFTVQDGVEMISVLTKKTGVRISVPVLPMARRILDKREGLPRFISNQKLNDYIKEACEMAGIKEPVLSVRIRSGRRIESTAPKYSLVTTHTARRSFATNEYLRAIKEGRDWRPIMAITGHKKEGQFFDYIRVSSEQNAILFSRARKAEVG